MYHISLKVKKKTREDQMRTSQWVVMILMVCAPAYAAESAKEEAGMSASDALERLKEGNKRYAGSEASQPNQEKSRREEVARGQHPFAVILGCADSRVPPEIIFDQGLGDLFVNRVAGAIVDDALLGSIEYAVEHLGVRLIVVLGHEKCGAVAATLAGGEASGHIGSLVDAIRPAMDKWTKEFGDTPALDNLVRLNVTRAVDQLKSSEPILSEFVKEGKLDVVGARYDLDDGTVEFITPLAGEEKAEPEK